MNKKVLGIAVALMAVAMLATPLVSAVPWTYPKNNDKFEDFSVVGTFSLMDFVLGEHEYIPSFEEVNKLIITFEENMLTYEITVDGKTYTMGEDFAYSGSAKGVWWDPVFATPAKKYPSAYRNSELLVDYMFNFSAFSDGIEGILRMRAVFNNGGLFINSLAGTDDLQNVQIKATQTGQAFDRATGIVTISHGGIVSGWPE